MGSIATHEGELAIGFQYRELQLGEAADALLTGSVDQVIDPDAVRAQHAFQRPSLVVDESRDPFN